jgi:chorismate lyase / 3-hydroxybenzoate synthase
VPVENPRQIPAWRYSARYGPRPPCFSRATIATVNGCRRLLIGGTVSIVGENSRHELDTEGQLEETLANLAALIGAARDFGESATTSLARLIDLRVYIVRAEDAPMIASVLRARCPAAHHVEQTVARLCRPELLVEIEGIADIQDASRRASGPPWRPRRRPRSPHLRS